MKDIEKLAGFFRSGAITVDNRIIVNQERFQTSPKPSGPFLFNLDGETYVGRVGICVPSYLEPIETVRKGLRWVGRMKHSGFSITSAMQPPEKFRLLETDSASKLVRNMLAYPKNNEETLANLLDQREVAKQEIGNWLKMKIVPPELIGILDDPSESRSTLQLILGRATYKHKKARGFGCHLKELLDYHSKEASDSREKRRKEWDELGKDKIRKTLENLARNNIQELAKRRFESDEEYLEAVKVREKEQKELEANRDPKSQIDWEEWKKINEKAGEIITPIREKYYGPLEDVLNDSICALTEIAKSIRKTYRINGKRVPMAQGIVRTEDYHKLFSMALDQYETNPLMTAGIISCCLDSPFYFFTKETKKTEEILQTAREWGVSIVEESSLKEAFEPSMAIHSHQRKDTFVVSVYFPTPSLGSIYWEDARFREYLGEVCRFSKLHYLEDETFNVIGNYRFHELLKESRTPYKHEVRALTGILTIYKNRKMFKESVDIWLKRQGESKIDWQEINKQIERAKLTTRGPRF